MADWEPVAALVKPLEEWGIDGPLAEVLGSKIIDHEWTGQERASLAEAFADGALVVVNRWAIVSVVATLEAVGRAGLLNSGELAALSNLRASVEAQP